MPLLRGEGPSGSAHVCLRFVAILAVIVSVFLIRDALAGDSSKYSTVTPLDINSIKKKRIEHFFPRGFPDPDSPISFPSSPDKWPRTPFVHGVPFSERTALGLSGVGPLTDAHGSNKRGTTAKREEQSSSGAIVQTSVGGFTQAPRLPSLPSENLAPLKPTLAAGAIYRNGGDESDSRLALDFLLPARLDSNNSLFFESRAEYQDACLHLWRSFDHRFDLSLGLGYRRVWQEGPMVGANAFLDTSRLDRDWSSALGFGFELALPFKSGVWDASLNFYQGGGVDLKTAYTIPVSDDRFDLRFNIDKYRFFDGEFILGWKGGVEISTLDRFIAVSYEYGQDSKNPEYHVIGCAVAVPFRLENIFSGKNPFELPVLPGEGRLYRERLQSDGVKRAWRKPDTVVEARNTPQGRRWTAPGKLADSLWSSSKPAAHADTTRKEEPRPCQPSRDCECKEAKKSDKEDNTLCCLLKLLFGTSVGQTTLAVGAAYLVGDYAYRNAFGPFELEPYELERIRQEMPKSRRRKQAGQDARTDSGQSGRR